MSIKDKVKKLKPIAEKNAIKRKRVWIDANIVNTMYKHLDDRVIFGVFSDDGDPAIVPEDISKAFKPKITTDVCFGSLIGSIRYNKANRMFYTIEVCLPTDENYPPMLTHKERIRWITIAKKYRMLPQYIDSEVVKDTDNKTGVVAKATVIIDLEKLPLSLLYIYLSTIRNIREDPGLPKAVLYLVDELGMNFYLAYVLASAVTLNMIGHHILTAYRPYGLCTERWIGQRYVCSHSSIDNIEQKVKIPIKLAIGLQRMLSNPQKYDERDYMADRGIYGFRCSEIIGKISTVNYQASTQELFDDNIIAATMSEADKEADKYINKFKKESPNIIYMEAKK